MSLKHFYYLLLAAAAFAACTAEPPATVETRAARADSTDKKGEEATVAVEVDTAWRGTIYQRF